MIPKHLVTKLHTTTTRDYLARVNNTDKATAAEKAMQWGYDYWDGSRDTGYGGYRYDGRWAPIAEELISTYNLTNGSKILDVGCGKGFLLHELKTINAEFDVHGLDISSYAIDNSMETIKHAIKRGSAPKLPWEADYFDLVISINTLHNLALPDLWKALKEINRVGKKDKYICVESYRNEREKVNLLYWQLTCKSFLGVGDWDFVFKETEYEGDYEFIYFE